MRHANRLLEQEEGNMAVNVLERFNISKEEMTEILGKVLESLKFVLKDHGIDVVGVMEKYDYEEEYKNYLFMDMNDIREFPREAGKALGFEALEKIKDKFLTTFSVDQIGVGYSDKAAKAFIALKGRFVSWDHLKEHKGK